MKKPQSATDAFTRRRLATLVDEGIGARPVRIWKILPLPCGASLSLVGQDKAGDAQGHPIDGGSSGESAGYVAVEDAGPAQARLPSGYLRKESRKSGLDPRQHLAASSGEGEPASKSHPLILAVRAGDLAAAAAALDAGADPDTADERGDPGLPLRIAAFKGHLDLVRLLVHRGAAVEPPVRLPSASPMAMAMRGGGKETVALLVELGATIPPGLSRPGPFPLPGKETRLPRR